MSVCLAERKVAIVTGASRGIGYAVARRLVESGYAVTITARDERALVQAASELGDDAVLAVAGAADDLDHRAAAVEQTVERFGGIDVLVNNTGINPLSGPLIEADLNGVRKTMEVNAIAALGWTQEVYRASLGERGGSVVNMASVVGLGAAATIGAYAMSKAAMIHLTGQLARELAPSVRVNAVAPALVHTRFAAPVFERDEVAAASAYPLERLGEPADVAAAVAFLLSDGARWITGETIVVDGGLGLTAYDSMSVIR